ncbi:hypothetical protein [Orenia marismortui]|uniref:hypothetical protein n=1 Tax=Orenia marismortui TaxID=46469 RepID=UPI00035CB120|nr:hypothetical protein [Orenia marismortui]
MEESLYYCPICDQDTLHDVLGENSDNISIQCTLCHTKTVAEPENFHNYEEVSMGWDEEIKSILDSWED